MERRGLPVPHLVHPGRAGADLHEAEAEVHQVVPRDCSHNRRGCALERGARAGRELVLEVPDAVRDRGHRRHGGRAALRAEEVHARRAGFSFPAGIPRRVEGEVGGGGGEEGEVGEAAEPEIAPAEASDTAGFSSLDEMIAAGNRAGDAENEAGNQGILDEWNNKFGTYYKSLDEVDITDADPPPEPPPRVQSLRARAPKFEVEGAEEGQPGGGTPAEIVSRQPANIEVEGAEVGPDLGDAVPADIVQSAMPAAEADPEVAEMGEEFFRNLASQQSSTADSTLARMGLGGLEHPAAGSQEESAQPKTFEPDAPEPEAEAPSGYKDLPDFGEEETGGEAGGEAAGETCGDRGER